MAYKPIKPFLTYDKQLDKLANIKQLTINNRPLAFDALKNISYYSLIDGYKILFYTPMTRTYEQGTTFEDILNLYNFDRQLRSLILKNICSIEQLIRSLLSYHFCEMHSANQYDYLNPHNYNYTARNEKGIKKLLNILSNEVNQNQEHNYIVYQRNTYNNVPLWVAINTLTFGQTSKMYSYLTTSLQSKISTNFLYVNERELSQYLKVLTHFRNICAHNERLFSFKSRYEIPDTLLHKKLNISQTGNHYTSGKSDLFALFITFRYLLPHKEFLEFKKEFTKLLNTFKKLSNNYTYTKLLKAMGLPPNWSSITRYKL